MILTEKETMLLNDLKSEEQLCIDKYNKYASEACDPQLKNVFTSIGQIEQNHYDTITQMINGTVPSTNMGGSQKPNRQILSFNIEHCRIVCNSLKNKRFNKIVQHKQK